MSQLPTECEHGRIVDPGDFGILEGCEFCDTPVIGTGRPDSPALTILDEALALVDGDRQDAYDHPAEDYARVVAMFNAGTGRDLTSAEGVYFMLCVKMARLGYNLQSDQLHRDSAVDLAGYVECLARVFDAR